MKNFLPEEQKFKLKQNSNTVSDSHRHDTGVINGPNNRRDCQSDFNLSVFRSETAYILAYHIRTDHWWICNVKVTWHDDKLLDTSPICQSVQKLKVQET